MALHSKVTGSALAGALAGMLIAELDRRGIKISGTEASDLTVIVSFMVGYFVSDNSNGNGNGSGNGSGHDIPPSSWLKLNDPPPSGQPPQPQPQPQPQLQAPPRTDVNMPTLGD